MTMSGIKADNDCQAAYEDVKHRRSAYVIFKISKNEGDTQEMIMTDYNEKDPNFIKPVNKSDNKEKMNGCLEQLRSKLAPKEPRYILLNVYQTIDDNNNLRDHEKMIFILWNPDSAPINQKMMYSASKDSLKKICVGCNIDMQCNDMDDLSHKDMTDSARKK